MKICKKCNKEKELCEFHVLKNSKDGKQPICKICTNERQKEYSKNNREKILIKKKKYRESEHGKLVRKEYRRQYYLNNKKFENERSSIWNQKNKHKMVDYVRKYQKEYYNKNKELMAWRRLLHNSLKKLGKKKEGHTIDLIGYSALELKNHITSLFTEGMSWDNYGEWHIDHIKPIISFTKDTPMDIVNALSNLQPLWATTREINGIIYEGNLNKQSKF
jgi:hypothetical protein